MARITRRVLVCDVGMEKCDNETLHQGRLTLDGKTRAFVLCPKHARPLLAFAAPEAPRSRGRVYTMAEIRRRKA